MGVLLMLMTIGGLFVAAILLIVSFWKKINWLKKFVFGGIAVWFGFYIALLLGSSLLSEEKTLGLAEPKQFCGFYLDCHIHTAVADVRRSKTYGGAAASGEFYIVKIKVFSDAKQAALNLTTPQFHVLDETGKSYNPVENPAVPRPPFDDKVPAGGSFEKEIVFDLPVEIKNPRLDIKEGYGIDRVIEAVLIGDEDSILHKRNFFKLDASNQLANNSK